MIVYGPMTRNGGREGSVVLLPAPYEEKINAKRERQRQKTAKRRAKNKKKK